MTNFSTGSIIHFLEETVDGDIHFGYYETLKDFDPESEEDLFKASDKHFAPCSVEGWDGLYADERYIDWLKEKGVLKEIHVVRISLHSNVKKGLSQYLLN